MKLFSLKTCRYLLTVYLYCCSFCVHAQDKTDIPRIEQIVQQWNDSHNLKDTAAFKSLYAGTLWFYGRYTDRDKCLQKKAEFLKGKFHQKIVSSIQITFHASNTVKCSFTKEVIYKQKVKDYPSYLLLQKRDDYFVITGESDLITDQNLHVQAPVSEKDTSGGNMLGWSIVILCVGGITAAMVYKFKSKRPVQDEKNIPAFIPIENTTLTNEEKGFAFEKYVSELFPDRFVIKEWRSDKIHRGRYAESSKLPDFAIELKADKWSIPFSIECKWRKGFDKDGKISWAQAYQLDNYRNYQNDTRQDVFIVIGLGGEPSAPSELYILPLREINNVQLSEQELKRYKRTRKSSFFLDVDRMQLT
jgi:hypothetical protein